MKKMVFQLLLMILALSLTGCHLLESILYKEYSRKSDVERQIDDLKKKHDADVASKISDVQVKLEKTIQAQDNQLQEGANKLYGANEAFKFYTTPSRLDLIINNRVVEAQAAIGKSPTYEAIKAENQRLKDELDEKKTSLEDLIKKHNQVVADNARLVDQANIAKKEVQAAKDEWLKTEQKYITDAKSLNDKLKEANAKIQAALQEKLDNAAAVERMQTKLMIGCGIMAALCVLGTIYSPVGKSSLAIAAATFGGAAVAIPHIQGWMILAAALVICVIVTIIFLYKHHVADTTNENLINHIQDIKENPSIPDEVKTIIKGSLSQWNSKYVGDKLSQADNKVEDYIKSKLKDYGRL
jgi:hypothetical protein